MNPKARPHTSPECQCPPCTSWQDSQPKGWDFTEVMAIDVATGRFKLVAGDQRTYHGNVDLDLDALREKNAKACEEWKKANGYAVARGGDGGK